MPFNPSLPADHTPLDAGEMRGQLTSLNTDIQSRVDQPTLNAAMVQAVSDAINGTLPQTSANSNAVNEMAQSADGTYNPSQMQDVINKINELIGALRR